MENKNENYIFNKEIKEFKSLNFDKQTKKYDIFKNLLEESQNLKRIFNIVSKQKSINLNKLGTIIKNENITI